MKTNPMAEIGFPSMDLTLVASACEVTNHPYSVSSVVKTKTVILNHPYGNIQFPQKFPTRLDLNNDSLIFGDEAVSKLIDILFNGV